MNALYDAQLLRPPRISRTGSCHHGCRKCIRPSAGGCSCTWLIIPHLATQGFTKQTLKEICIEAAYIHTCTHTYIHRSSTTPSTAYEVDLRVDVLSLTPPNLAWSYIAQTPRWDIVMTFPCCATGSPTPTTNTSVGLTSVSCATKAKIPILMRSGCLVDLTADVWALRGVLHGR
ncbi:uncharacterized protein K489DRAFT_192988 [Dissoconium aciculare CBS 342.82]|uniref:Uncharacterized protein n=1 Tax=Dissoconium aciculare CBS 342.82 TaxID=1314786 RepID=A0A6J3M5K3_9PEZI|nr:uncharacterized protein K489DRAFT_192988 [Dissoconium aciculare CBS 342.82]KAF1823325.1 hypothetical protein K489DRAFT_192988 [Dissoconium aciculare CBS 342.82]